jgi:rhodanese-related sulfurtransferase
LRQMIGHMSKFLRFAGMVIVGAATAMLGSIPASAGAKNDLAVVEAKIAAEFPTLDHIGPDVLEGFIKAGKPVLILDVREEAEYAVSRLVGARRVAPNSDAAQFVRDIAAEAKGKTIVFYCSVGKRSSTLASKSAAGLAEAGVAGVHNLRGGIFRWSNEGRPLEKGPASSPGKSSNSGVEVHPYNNRWGQMIDEPTAPTTVQ